MWTLNRLLVIPPLSTAKLLLFQYQLLPGWGQHSDWEIFAKENNHLLHRNGKRVTSDGKYAITISDYRDGWLTVSLLIPAVSLSQWVCNHKQQVCNHKQWVYVPSETISMQSQYMWIPEKQWVYDDKEYTNTESIQSHEYTNTWVYNHKEFTMKKSIQSQRVFDHK